MNYKRLFSICIIIIILVIGYFIIFRKPKVIDTSKFYLNDNYYNKGEFISSDDNDINNLIAKKDSFLLFVYNNYCTLPISCDSIFQGMMDEYKIDIVEITFANFKKTSLYEEVKLAPSIIIIKDGVIVDYLKADRDEDLIKYQDVSLFSEWLNKYISLEKR